MIIFDTVTKKYKENITALEDVSFRVDPGAVSYTHLTLPTIYSV